jgi:hypothetical protein
VVGGEVLTFENSIEEKSSRVNNFFQEIEKMCYRLADAKLLFR